MGTVVLTQQQRELVKFMNYYTLRSTKKFNKTKKSTNRLYEKIGLRNDVVSSDSVRLTQTI